MSLHPVPGPSNFVPDGFCVFRAILTPTEVDLYKSRLAAVSGLSEQNYHERWSLADGLTQHADFWPLIFNQRLVESVRSVIGASARFVQCTDLHVHRASLSWHRDSANRNFAIGPDWAKDYRVVRVAFYLHPHSFGIIPGSHTHEHRLSRVEMRFWQALAKLNSDPIPQFAIRTHNALAPTRPRWIDTQPGDAIVFDARLLHAAPPVTGPKYALFSCYGADDVHSRNHQNYYLRDRRELNYKALPPKLVQQLKAANLYLTDDEESQNLGDDVESQKKVADSLEP